MKLKNRRGSTLALTLMVFAVLMIFATFILGFMVTENKQAMYFQNKTQAYYIARSGAEVVEAALKDQLYSYSDNKTNQRAFIDVYMTPGKDISVSIDGIKDNKVKVVNDTINGKRVMTIQSTAEYRGIEQSVKKVIYSTESRITETMDGQFVPTGGELFIYLGDVEPKQIYKNDTSWSYIPKAYVRHVNEEEKAQYTTLVAFPTISDWSVANGIVVGGKINAGNYSLPEGVTDIFVDGPLIMQGNINFSGKVNIYIKETLTINDNTLITGETQITPEGKVNNLNIYVYNTGDSSIALSTPPSSNISIVGNLYVEKGDVSISVHQSGYIDGHIIYHGTGEIKFSSNSNNYTDTKLLTGSIYAPLGTVSLGIHTNKTANIIGGQVLANIINVYPNNNTQANKFYSNSTKGRINNPVPVDITQNIDIKQIGYESFYIE